MAADASFSSTRHWKYDVFLSFRGPDTRQTFTGHLYKALVKLGVVVFKDDEELRKGEVIQVLLKSIEDSKLSVVVLSQNYAYSKWCLKELAQIVECMDTKKQAVVLIFYQVDPADVRYQRKSFNEAFDKHEHDGRVCREDLQRWKSSLTRAADLVGWESTKYEDDAELVEDVVEEILEKLSRIRSSESESSDLVGIDYHIQEMENLLRLDLDVVRTVGIWGMGGLGKTTIARAVYNKFSCDFQASLFLENVRQIFKGKGEGQMQEELLSRIFKKNVWNSSTLYMRMLRKISLFLVLDDVEDLAQIEALLGKNPSFSPGSRIIITTRNKHLPSEYVIYHPRFLRYNEALELFMKYAKPTEECSHLSSRAIAYAKGLPLAVKVLGASLSGRKSTCEWEEELEKIRKFQNHKIQGVLRTSFEGLDHLQKELFLDVACFFRGIRKDYATLILGACKLCPIIGLRDLADRALVTTSGYHSPVLGMHDLLHNMALGIVRQQSSPSRLTFLDDLEDALSQYTVDELRAVESIDLDLYKSKNVSIDAGAFNSMKKLRLLRIHYNRYEETVADHSYSREELYHLSDECKQNVIGNLMFLSHQLRCLIWHGCPLKSLPNSFLPKFLVDLDMSCSHIEQLWEQTKPLENLKFISLSFSLYLKKIPDLKLATNLEKLNLEGCTSLKEVHSSISDLENLVFLSLKGCKELEILPRSIRMKSLKVLELSGCSKLEKFPEISGVMEKLPMLCLDKTLIQVLPSSVKNLTGLVTLSLKDCRKLKSLPRSICRLKSLKYIILSGCSELQLFPEIAGLKDLQKLKELHLDRTSIKEFLPSTSALKNLALLNLRGCKELKSLPSKIKMVSLESLILSGCSKLERFPDILGTMYWLSELDLHDIAIKELHPSIGNLIKLRSLSFTECGEIKSLPSSIFQLRHLEVITMCSCPKFEVFPDTLDDLEQLEALCISTMKLPDCKRLYTLRLMDCGNLKSLPKSFCLLKSLRFVSLSGCSKFEVFPDVIEDMEELRELHLDGTSIAKLPPSIDRLTRLTLLNMRNCKSLVFLPVSISNLSSLTNLVLSGCSNFSANNLGKSLEDIQTDESNIKHSFSTPSSFSNCIIGRDRHINQMQKLLCPLLMDEDQIRIVGICGMSGSGKTTVARLVYEEMSHKFKHHCFLVDVSKGFRKHGAAYMEEELLSRIFKVKVQNVDSYMKRNRLYMENCLLVIDDVEIKSHVEILLKKLQPIGGGSRVIITTRNRFVLSGFEIYSPNLTDVEAIELFTKYAFKEKKPQREHNDLLRFATEYADGLPLALKVLGLFLSEKSTLEWKSVLEDRKRGVQHVFLTSFEGLHDSEKNIFLDVACFYKGMPVAYVAEILHGSGLFPYSILRALVDRSLIFISDRDGTLEMHDIIQEVGRDQTRLESVHCPGERSRLWSYEAIQCLAREHRVTKAVEAITFDLSNSSKDLVIVAQAFVTMKKLRLLRIFDDYSNNNKQRVIGDLTFISHELRCLIWHRYPLKSLPSNFHPKNLVDLDMRFSHLVQLWEGSKLLQNLKFINLSYSPDLEEMPDLSEAPNLKKLILDGCTSLFQVHTSIWDHKNLVVLSLKGCSGLKILPRSIHLKSLQTLNLDGCSGLDKFPVISEVMTLLSELNLDETAIRELPSSIVRLQGLESLSLRNCTSLVSLPDSMCSLAHLQLLYLDGCSKLIKFPKFLKNTESLTISGIEGLPIFVRSRATESNKISESISESREDTGGKEETEFEEITGVSGEKDQEMEGVVQGDEYSEVGGFVEHVQHFHWLRELYP